LCDWVCECLAVEAIEPLCAAMERELPALLITGDNAPEHRREAVASGLPLQHKPVSSSRIRRALVTVLRGEILQKGDRQPWSGS